MTAFFVFVISFSEFVFKQKITTSKIDNAASSGGLGELTYFIYFLWPPLEAGLSSSMLFAYLKVLGSFFFSY